MLAAGAVAIILLCGGIASLVALPAGSASIPTRIAATFGLGYTVVLAVATVLVLAHAMRPWAMALLLAATASAGLAWTLRSTGLGATLRGLGLEATASWPVALPGIAVVAAISVARLRIPADPSAGGWRYWADGLEIADAGKVPSQVLQWGAMHSPAISKLGANSYDAALAFALRDHAFSAMAASLWLSSAGLAACLFALAWELGLRWTAAVIPLAAMSGTTWLGGLMFDADIVRKLEFFQTEDAGRMCMVAAVALAVPVIRGEPSRPRAVAALVLTAAGALTHLVAVLALIAFLALYALAVIVLQRGGWRAVGRRFATIAGGGAAIAAAALVLAGGDLGFEGASGGTYHLTPGGDDPTAALMRLHRRPIEKSQRRFYTPPRSALRNLFTTATSLHSAAGPVAITLVLLALAGLAAVLLGGRAERTAAVASAGTLVAYLGIELVFSYRFSYYIPATFGDRRLFEYAGLPMILLGAAGANALIGRARRIDVRAPLVCAAALPALAVVPIGVSGLRGGLHRAVPTSSMIQVTRLNTPCNARLLTPSPSRGSFEALTGRASIQEGLMVFLRPDLLDQAIALEAQARQFYKDPRSHIDFLRQQSVDDVLARPAATKRLMRVPGLELSGRSGRVSVFRVTLPGLTAAPHPNDAPGYRCVRVPLA